MSLPHEYIPSQVGHGEAQCKWCMGTNRENAIISPNYCEFRPTEQKPEVQLELDCYHKAEPDEPKFTLLARDPLAPFLVAMWAALRRGDTANAVCVFADMVAEPGHKYRTVKDANAEKLSSACNIATDMIVWRGTKGLEVSEVPYLD